MTHRNKYRNSVIAAATEILEEELEQESVDVVGEKIQEAYVHLRHNLVELGLDLHEEEGGTVEHIRAIARKGREYLTSIAREGSEKPTDDWERLFATALGVPAGVAESDLVEAIMDRVSAIRQESSDLRDELEDAMEILIEHLELPLTRAFGVSEERVGEGSKEVLENLARLKQSLHEAEEKAERIIQEAVSQLPTNADKREALAFVSFL